MSSSRNHEAAFAAVLGPVGGSPAPRAARPLVATENLREFISACETALGSELLASDELLPGVDVHQPGPVLLAFLVFLACERVCPDPQAPITEARIGAWHGRVPLPVWGLLGFERRPERLTLQLAFRALCQAEFLSPQAWPLVWAIGDLAASGLLTGVER